MYTLAKSFSPARRKKEKSQERKKSSKSFSLYREKTRKLTH